MNIILFGPPGVGKSTLIGDLKTAGYGAIDLEDLYPNRIRFQIPNLSTTNFIGGADLDPKRKYANSVRVLLVMDQKAYESRRKARDAKVPGKASQREQLIADWKKGVTYDAIVDVTDHSKAMDSLISIYRRYNNDR